MGLQLNVQVQGSKKKPEHTFRLLQTRWRASLDRYEAESCACDDHIEHLCQQQQH